MSFSAWEHAFDDLARMLSSKGERGADARIRLLALVHDASYAGAYDALFARAGIDHLHGWERLADLPAVFSCTDRLCFWFAVCPGCLGSLAVALSARERLDGLAVYWCPDHRGRGAEL